MKAFIAAPGSALLEQSVLAGSREFWSLPFEAMNLPGSKRSGWSSVCRHELDSAAFYLKRLGNHLVRSLHHPFGERALACYLEPLVRCTKRIGYDRVQWLLLTYSRNDWLLEPWARRLTRRCQIREARG